MKRTVLIVLTDGFADWEASYVSAELNRSTTDYQVKTIAIDHEPKVSMGGLRVLPDYVLDEMANISNVAMLIIPGGTGWRDEKNLRISTLVQYFVQQDIPIAAICDATAFLGNHGFLDNNQHTGNTLEYLKQSAPNYKGDHHYVSAQSVSAGSLITANGSGAVEFTRDILEKLGVLKEEQLEEWYHVFKKGYIPALA
ncbi:MAG: glutamine amidotransferase [Paenibacillus sp.]|jgi:putative intracellular protease/amidase|nr:glutamine amidotransferase [Paenibacillus sp.]